MTLKLHYGSGSPFAWRTQLAVAHKQVPHELVTVSFSDGDQLKPEFLAMNPRHKVPVLQDGDFALFESAAIVEYLEDRFPEAPHLFPKDAQRRAIVRRLVQEVDFYVWPQHWVMASNLFFKSSPDDWDLDAIGTARAALVSELERFETLVEGPFLAGEVSAADFALYPFVATFVRFELRKDDLGLSKAMGPEVAAWKRQVEALPYFGDTYPPHWKK